MRKTDGSAGRIRRRIRILWCLVAVMLVWMVVVGETGGDQRVMTDLAELVSRVIYFGGLGVIIWRIVHNKKLLRDRQLMREELARERDEYSQWLYERSGGTVMDVMMVILLFTTVTAAMYDMAAFHVALFLLVSALGLKVGAYLLIRRGGGS